LSGLIFFAIEPPDCTQDLWPACGLIIDAGPGKRLEVPPPPTGAFLHWIYVAAWNSFMHIAARDASIEWE
jgi:hypothetical protein